MTGAHARIELAAPTKLHGLGELLRNHANNPDSDLVVHDGAVLRVPIAEPEVPNDDVLPIFDALQQEICATTGVAQVIRVNFSERRRE